MYLACRHTTSSPRPTFADILRPDTNVVNMPRALNGSMATRLIKLVRQASFSHEARVDIAAMDVSALLVSVHDDRVRRFLEEDIGYLAQQMGSVLGRQHVHATLFVQRSDGCQKIHADNLNIRLLCTYAGPGTDWLPNEEVVRKYLGPADMDVVSANKRIMRAGATLRRCAPGDVLLLKGNAHPGNAGKGAAHRSPPLGASGTARLVLKIDEHPCGC